MENILLTINSTKKEFMEKWNKEIELYEFQKLNSRKLNTYLGEIKNDELLLTFYSQGYKVNNSMSCFKGKIKEEEGKLKIEGKFVFPPFLKFTFSIMCLIILLMIIFTFPSTATLMPFAMFSYVWTNLFYHSDVIKETIINKLKEMGDDPQDYSCSKKFYLNNRLKILVKFIGILLILLSIFGRLKIINLPISPQIYAIIGFLGVYLYFYINKDKTIKKYMMEEAFNISNKLEYIDEENKFNENLNANVELGRSISFDCDEEIFKKNFINNTKKFNLINVLRNFEHVAFGSLKEEKLTLTFIKYGSQFNYKFILLKGKITQENNKVYAHIKFSHHWYIRIGSLFFNGILLYMSYLLLYQSPPLIVFLIMIAIVGNVMIYHKPNNIKKYLLSLLINVINNDNLIKENNQNINSNINLKENKKDLFTVGSTFYKLLIVFIVSSILGIFSNLNNENFQGSKEFTINKIQTPNYLVDQFEVDKKERIYISKLLEDVVEIYNPKGKFLGTISIGKDEVLVNYYFEDNNLAILTSSYDYENYTIYYFDVDNMLLKDKIKCNEENLIEYSDEEIRVGDSIGEFIHPTFEKNKVLYKLKVNKILVTKDNKTNTIKLENSKLWPLHPIINFIIISISIAVIAILETMRKRKAIKEFIKQKKIQ